MYIYVYIYIYIHIYIYVYVLLLVFYVLMLYVLMLYVLESHSLDHTITTKLCLSSPSLHKFGTIHDYVRQLIWTYPWIFTAVFAENTLKIRFLLFSAINDSTTES